MKLSNQKLTDPFFLFKFKIGLNGMLVETFMPLKGTEAFEKYLYL